MKCILHDMDEFLFCSLFFSVLNFELERTVVDCISVGGCRLFAFVSVRANIESLVDRER